MAVGNLRGLKEAGRLFAVPTYVYTVFLGLLIGYGIYKIGFQDLGTDPGQRGAGRGVRRGAGRRRRAADGVGVACILLLRAFSSGAVVLAGVEAISNGVPAFRKPKSKNAAQHPHDDGG